MHFIQHFRGWGAVGVNHKLIFELDPRQHASFQVKITILAHYKIFSLMISLRSKGRAFPFPSAGSVLESQPHPLHLRRLSMFSRLLLTLGPETYAVFLVNPFKVDAN